MRILDVRPEDRGSIVRVLLRDTTMADALHPTVAEATGVVDPVRDEVEVTLEVPQEGLDRRHRNSLWAHVDHEGTGQPGAGRPDHDAERRGHPRRYRRPGRPGPAEPDLAG